MPIYTPAPLRVREAHCAAPRPGAEVRLWLQAGFRRNVEARLVWARKLTSCPDVRNFAC